MLQQTLLEQTAAFLLSRMTRAEYVADGVATPISFYKKEVDGTKLSVWLRIPANPGVVTEINLYDEEDVAVYRLLQTLSTPPSRPTYARIEIDTKEMSL